MHVRGGCRGGAAAPRTQHLLALAPDVLGSQAVADCEERLHAVRSSLAGLSGALYLLVQRRDELPDNSRGRLETLLVGEVERLSRMVAPPPGAERSTSVEDIDLDRLLESLVLGRHVCGQDVWWLPTGAWVRGRADDLVEVLSVLLVNAWRHAGDATVRIEVVRRGDSVEINVKDQGPGVHPELGERVFERSVRRTGSTGQGLGLAMARELAEDMGGTLTLASSTPRGACFRVTLPLSEPGRAAGHAGH